MLNKKNRIGNRNVIEKLFKKGHLHKNHFFIFKYEETKDSPPQFAVSVSKKMEKKAVRRNRLRRQIYEAIRLNLDSLNKNLAVLIIARPSILKSNFQEIGDHIKAFFKNT